jgi:small conductance mechanosensitive channel
MRLISPAHPIVRRIVSATSSDELISDQLSSGDWLRAGAIVVGSLAVAAATIRIARALLERALGQGFAAIITARLIGYVVAMIGLVYALGSLGVRIGPLLGALGLGGLVLALALQKVAENFVGALILQTRRPFTVGDTVDLDGNVGVVTDVDARTTVLRGLDGSMIRIPNGEVLNAAIVNKTREAHRRSELAVGVAYDTDLERATEVLGEAVDRVRRVSSTPPPAVMLRQFGASSIDFTIYYWHRSDVPSELAATHDLMIAVHHALADAGITIAFPQMVVWPGHDATDDPYRRTPDQVFTDRRTVEPASSGGRSRDRTGTETDDASRWKLPWRS